MNKGVIESCMRDIITSGLGLDLGDPNIADTPARVARMFVDELFKNTHREFDGFTLFPNNKDYDELIISEDIDFVSVCSHHFLPFHGKAYFGYVPDKHVVGLSKLSRVVCHYAARPQIQENLTHEIMGSFVKAVQPLGAMLILRAYHSCQSIRGAKQANALMTTSAVHGIMKTDFKVRQEMLSVISLKK
jgi:GTP cyclohydrolase I